jgi:hypothetical protein
MKKNPNLTSLDSFIDKEYGLKGTKKRDKFEAEYEAFKLGVMELNLYQQQYAQCLCNCFW